MKNKTFLKVKITFYGDVSKKEEVKYFALVSNAIEYATSRKWMDVEITQPHFCETMEKLRKIWESQTQHLSNEKAIERIDEESYQTNAGKLFDIKIRFEALKFEDSF